MASEALRYSRPWERALLWTVTLVAVALVLFPFAWLLLMSFKTDEAIFAWPPTLLFEPTLANYRALWDDQFRQAFANSAITSVASTGLALILGVPVAGIDNAALTDTLLQAVTAVSGLVAIFGRLGAQSRIG